MLRNGISFFVLFTFMVSSCNERNNIQFVDFSSKDKYLLKYSANYTEIFNSANDSIEKWIKDSLEVITPYFFYSYKINDVLIFNRDSTLFITTINLKDNRNKNSIADDLSDFGGAKIDENWYFFFMGVSEPIVRSYWQDSVYKPLSYEELSYAAYDRRFRRIVEAVLNDDSVKVAQFFERKFTELPACSSYPIELKQHCQDSIILASVSGKYNYKLTKEEISEIRNSMMESKIPENEPLVKSCSWWDKLRYGEKVFESEEWKDYLKNKYGSKWEEHI